MRIHRTRILWRLIVGLALTLLPLGGSAVFADPVVEEETMLAACTITPYLPFPTTHHMQGESYHSCDSTAWDHYTCVRKRRDFLPDDQQCGQYYYNYATVTTYGAFTCGGGGTYRTTGTSFIDGHYIAESDWVYGAPTSC